MPAFPERAAVSTCDVQIAGDWWVRARHLTPIEAAEAGELMQMAVALSLPEQVYQSEKRPEPTRGQLQQIQTRTEAILCACVFEGSTDGEEWEPLTFVTQQQAHNPDHSRLWIGVVAPHQRGLLLNHILMHYCEAREVLRPFHNMPEIARVARLVRQALRNHASKPAASA